MEEVGSGSPEDMLWAQDSCYSWNKMLWITYFIVPKLDYLPNSGKILSLVWSLLITISLDATCFACMC